MIHPQLPACARTLPPPPGSLTGSVCGSDDCGTIFQVDPATGAFTSLYQLQGGADGAKPGPVLIAGPGEIYGNATGPGATTCSGPCRTMFAYTP